MPPSSTTSDPHPLVAIVRQTLATHAMVTAGDRVLVGVSGGPDSMTLLHLLKRLAPELGIQLGVAHLNHCLRGPAADKDAELVCQTAAALDYPYHLGRARVLNVKTGLHLSLEDAARRIRYAFFNKTMRDGQYTKLALGHHLDDNAEQVLLALLRGSGPRGLCGIAPVRDGCIIRPLIEIRREAIQAYAAEAGLACARDESNTDLRFVRNRLRHRLLPLLAEDYNPRVHHQLSQLADIMRCEEAWLETLSEESYAASVLERKQDFLTLCAETLRRFHPALARRLVRRAIQELRGDLRRIGFTHVVAVVRLLTGGGERKELHLPGGIRILRDGNRLVLQRMTVHRRGRITSGLAHEPVTPMVIHPPFPEHIEMASMGIGLRFRILPADVLPDWKTIRPQQAFFDLERISPPLVLRTTRPGDRFTPFGAAGSQKLKKFFIDHHIPKTERMMIPLLTDQARILWMVGRRIDHFPRLTSATKRILAVEFFLLDTR